MTDRELLEAAAKAAGIVFDRSPYNGGPKSNPGFTLDGNPVLDWHNFVIWNPLTDDGDAFRLAVKLGIEFGYGWNDDETIQRVIIDDNLHVMVEDGDACAAVRRAIVRAAADMAGKG